MSLTSQLRTDYNQQEKPPAKQQEKPSEIYKAMPLTSVLVVCKAHHICGSSFPHLVVLLSEFCVNLTTLRLDQAVQHGSMDLVHYLTSDQFEKTFSRSELIQAFQLACGIVGNLPIVKCLDQLAQQMHLSSFPWDAAASKGNLEIAQWLVNSRPHEHFSELALESACKNGHVDMVRFLVELQNQHLPNKSKPIDRKHVMVNPASFTARGFRSVSMVLPVTHTTTINCVNSCVKSTRKSALEVAARHGQTQVVQYMLTHGFSQFAIPALYEAARVGSIDILQLLLEFIDRQLQQSGDGLDENCEFEESIGSMCCWRCLMEAALSETRMHTCDWLLQEKLTQDGWFDDAENNCQLDHPLLDALECQDNDESGVMNGAKTAVVGFFKKWLSTESEEIQYRHQVQRKKQQQEHQQRQLNDLLHRMLSQEPLQCMKWLHKWFPQFFEKHHQRLTFLAMAIAIDRQDCPAVQWLLTHQQVEHEDHDLDECFSPQERLQLIQQAIDHGNVDILRVLSDHVPSNQETHMVFSIDQVVIQSHLAMAEFLVACGENLALALTCSDQTIEQVVWREDCRVLEVLLWKLRLYDSREQAWQWIESACEQGHMEMLRLILSRFGTSELLEAMIPDRVQEKTTTVLTKAVRNGHVGVVRCLLEKELVSPGTFKENLRGLLHEAASYAQFKMIRALLEMHLNLQSLHSPGFQASSFTRCNLSKVVGAAIAHGDLSMIQFLHDHQVVGFTVDSMDEAASRGFLNIVQFLHENRSEGCTTKAMDQAASCGHFDVVQFLHFHRGEGCTTMAMDEAAHHGHLHIVQFLHQHRSEGCSKRAMDDAARHGHFAVLEFLHFHRREGCTKRAMDEAAREGHFRIVQFLHRHRDEGCTASAMDDAAGRNGHLAMVEFLHRHRQEGCTHRAMDGAAANGFLHVLRFLQVNRTEGCSPQALNQATLRGHGEVVRWLLKHRRSEVNVQEAIELAQSSQAWNRSWCDSKEPMEQLLARYLINVT